jgi:hypothetical protein
MQLIHFITTTHPAYGGLLKAAEEEKSDPYEGLFCGFTPGDLQSSA